jgi:cupin fold WbuC family metalloprotein
MENFSSKLDTEKLVFSILKFNDINEKRVDICPDNEYMQVCGRIMNRGFFVPPHKHLKVNRETDMTQESWIILEGRVRASFYDIDSSYLCSRIIEKGDVVVFYRGGHSMEVLEDNTIFYEFKNGPYYGVENDKEKIP